MENSELNKTEQTTEKVKKNRKGRVIFSVLTVVFCSVIFLGGLSFVTGEDRNFSSTENRVLASMPSFSFNSVKDGSFMKDFEAYLTDQFVFRDGAIRLKSLLDRMAGKTRIGDVYVGKDGYLFSVPTLFNQKSIEEITEKLSAFADRNPESKITFMLSPNSRYVYQDKLPDRAPTDDQHRRINDIENYTASKNIDFINLSETFLSQKDEIRLFYKTDHHWTTRAANIAFNELMKRWEKSTADVGFSFLSVADSFQGTLSSKSGITSSSDIIEICVPQNSELSYVVDYENGEKKTATLFDGSKLEQMNKYEVFTGGNYGKITIDTTFKGKDTVLIVKDSYANCMLSMFTPFFAKIVVVDPRYTQEKLADIIEENGFTHILFLYNLDTFLEDTSLKDVLV